MNIKKRLNVFLLFAVVFLMAVSGGRKANAEENVLSLNVSGVTFEYMDDPYTGESYNDPIVSMHWNYGWGGSYGMISRENYNFYWRDVETGEILTDSDIFEKGKEYSLTLELPCEFDQNSGYDKETYQHYVYEEDFNGVVGGVAFTDEDYVIEGDKIIVKDIYSKICIDRPEDKIRIHSIDFRNISTKLYEGQDTNTLKVWKGYEETPVYINGNQKIEKGSVLDKNLHWSLWWVKLDYNEATDQFTLASPADTSYGWWNLDFKEVEPDTYYGLVMILRWEQHKNGPEIAVDADMLQGYNYKFVPMVNGDGIVQNCESTFFGDIWGGLDDENDPDSEFLGYELMAGVFTITKSLPADANPTAAPSSSSDVLPSATPSSAPNALPSIAPTSAPNALSSSKPSVSNSPAPVQTAKPDIVVKPIVKKVKEANVAVGKKKLTIKWKKSSDVSGYQIQISTKKNFKGAKKISISKSKNQYTKKKLKSKKKYYIRIRAYKTYKDANKKTQKTYGKWVTMHKKTK